jgi:hypothetical protein
MNTILIVALVLGVAIASIVALFLANRKTHGPDDSDPSADAKGSDSGHHGGGESSGDSGGDGAGD